MGGRKSCLFIRSVIIPDCHGYDFDQVAVEDGRSKILDRQPNEHKGRLFIGVTTKDQSSVYWRARVSIKG
jgi:hypothetical protein